MKKNYLTKIDPDITEMKKLGGKDVKTCTIKYVS